MEPPAPLTYTALIQQTERLMHELVRTAATSGAATQRDALRSQAIGAYTLFVRLARSFADASPDGDVAAPAAMVAADT
ncbi:hypothetical protein [Burkholderia glumae]|uniref:Uncharacterized protein n=1 Tax=Burkholderia glumae TaxID=337 RepID=A0ABY5BBU8_BURGL|nr:hypothetical protein [Burkholderia glumae]USS44477.1 hypothetical protein NFI99_13970 [Burkholderia glumae]UVT00295.1 hypothetical protein EFP20_00565 [Burkholderia glumae]